MAYIGRGLDKISNIEHLDTITFDGSSSYSLTKSSSAFTPNSAQSLIVSIDGVVQSDNFTVSGSTIDFGVAIPSTSTCDFIKHFGTGVAFTPADGTVTTAKLADSSVSLAKLSATGTKDATTFLRGDNTFAEVSSYADSDALTLFNASGSAPVYACRAWVQFQGTGTVAIRASGNVTSITDNGTGDYTVNFTTAIQDDDYAIAGTLREDTSGGVGNTTNRVLGLRRATSTVTTTSIRVGVANFSGGATDAETVYITIHR